MHYVYILQSEKDGGIYIGKTNNIKRRFAEHSDGFVSSTKSRRPFQLVQVITCPTECKARELEKKLKHGSSREKIKMYLNRK